MEQPHHATMTASAIGVSFIIERRREVADVPSHTMPCGSDRFLRLPARRSGGGLANHELRLGLRPGRGLGAVGHRTQRKLCDVAAQPGGVDPPAGEAGDEQRCDGAVVVADHRDVAGNVVSGAEHGARDERGDVVVVRDDSVDPVRQPARGDRRRIALIDIRTACLLSDPTKVGFGLGVSPATVGIVSLVTALAAFVAATLGDRLTTRIGERLALVVGGILVMASYLILIAGSGSLRIVVVAMVLGSLGNGVLIAARAARGPILFPREPPTMSAVLRSC